MTRVLITALAIALLAGCATGASKRSGSAVERAQARWDLMVAGEFAQAYDYLTPGFRSITSRDQYVAAQMRRPINRTAARVVESECTPDQLLCEVSVAVDVRVPPGMVPGRATASATSTISERWIFVDGAWYHAPKEIARGR